VDGPVTTLLERSDELELLGRNLEAAQRGTGSICLIEGKAGVGKTSLITAARHLAPAAGLVVLCALAGVLEGDLAWNLVRQLFGGLIETSHERDDLLSGAARLAAPALGLQAGADVGALHARSPRPCS
jgi:hypothetical protein